MPARVSYWAGSGFSEQYSAQSSPAALEVLGMVGARDDGPDQHGGFRWTASRASSPLLGSDAWRRGRPNRTVDFGGVTVKTEVARMTNTGVQDQMEKIQVNAMPDGSLFEIILTGTSTVTSVRLIETDAIQLAASILNTWIKVRPDAGHLKEPA